jgi:tetratricopeptide (TPR) repeat protein
VIILLIAAIGTLLGADGPKTGSNNISASGSDASITSKATNTVAEREYEQLMSEDDAAQAEVDKWIQENNAFKAKGAGIADAEMNRRIRQRFEPIRKGYEDFLKRYPDHARARLAYGSFLGDLQDEAGAKVQWEKALELDPKNPATYNNLAGIYSETGDVKKGFEFFTKAIELSPAEAIYYHNFADSLYVMRNKAQEIYGLNEQQVFTKALHFYSNAVRLAPSNFPFATDFAQTFYALKPFPAAEAMTAWTNTLKLAHDELERQGVYIHLARAKMLDGQLASAREQLDAITDTNYTVLKSNLIRSIKMRENPPTTTNASPPEATKKQSN